MQGATAWMACVDLTAIPIQWAPAPSAASCGIAFMAKASAPGRTKTRLVPPLTFDEAAALNTAFLCDVADNVLLAARHAAPQAGIAGYAAFGPTGAEDFFRRTLPGAIGLIGAWFPNFGDCLFHTIRELFARDTWVGCGAQFRQPDFADRAVDRDRGNAGAAGRPRRARPLYRRRLLSARAQSRASPHVRRHRLEHLARRRADAATRPRHRSRRSCPAGLVRCRRCRRLAAARCRTQRRARGTVRLRRIMRYRRQN